MVAYINTPPIVLQIRAKLIRVIREIHARNKTKSMSTNYTD